MSENTILPLALTQNWLGCWVGTNLKGVHNTHKIIISVNNIKMSIKLTGQEVVQLLFEIMLSILLYRFFVPQYFALFNPGYTFNHIKFIFNGFDILERLI